MAAHPPGIGHVTVSLGAANGDTLTPPVLSLWILFIAVTQENHQRALLHFRENFRTNRNPRIGKERGRLLSFTRGGDMCNGGGGAM